MARPTASWTRDYKLLHAHRGLAAYAAAGGSVSHAAELVGIQPSTVKRHLADLRVRMGLTTEQLIYRGRAEGWLLVPKSGAWVNALG